MATYDPTQWKAGQNRAPCKCCACGQFIPVDANIVYRQNPETQKWERAHDRCMSIPTQTPPSTPPAPASPPTQPYQPQPTPAPAGFPSPRQEIITDIALHPDQELRELFRDITATVSARGGEIHAEVKRIANRLDVLEVNLTSAQNRQAKAAEELVAAFKDWIKYDAAVRSK